MSINNSVPQLQDDAVKNKLPADYGIKRAELKPI